MRTHKALFVAVLFAAATVAVYADTKIEFKATENGGSAMSAFLIGQGKVRADVDQTMTIIIDPKEGAMTTIDRAKKSYTKITRADIQQITQMMANIPPGMEQMMQGRMAGRGGAQAPVVADTGETATVAGKSCRIFRTTQDGKAIAEACMADPNSVEIPAADRATMTSALAFAKELTDALAKAPMLAGVLNAQPFRSGLVPIRFTSIAADGTRKTSELAGVTSATLPADSFAIPSGFKEEKMGMGRGRGGN